MPDPTTDTQTLKPGLYLVATPIGNMQDITLRALEIFRRCDAVICEDTRVTGRLLQAHGLRKDLIAYHDHSDAARRAHILERLSAGQILALVSDAGTPMISDPGYKLVRDAVEHGYPVSPVPGANAVLSALQLSALPSDRFAFLGFLPAKTAAKESALIPWANAPASLVLYESGPRLASTLETLQNVFGDRPAAVAREITKLFEETRRDRLSALLAYYRESGPPKGEIAIVVGPPEDIRQTPEDLEDQIAEDLTAGRRIKDIAADLARSSGLPKKQIYDRALKIRNAKEQNGT